MQEIEVHGRRFRQLINHDDILVQIEQLGQRINQDFAAIYQNAAQHDNELGAENSQRKAPLLVITLSGAFMFGAELAKVLNFPVEIAFIKCCSYGSSMTSSGIIKIELDCTIDPRDRDVIVVEDIIESGKTYVALNRYMIERGATSVRIATLLYKPECYAFDLKIDYSAIEIGDDFVVGFGLDYNQRARELKHIYVIND